MVHIYGSLKLMFAWVSYMWPNFYIGEVPEPDVGSFALSGTDN